MSLRRSNRRLTITGASVFSASTPLALSAVKGNIDSGSSPQWLPAEEALNLKTPKFTRITRRTTLTRQNIFPEDENQENAEFKVPKSYFVAVSPTGMQTRSRRSSIYVAKEKNTVKSSEGAVINSESTTSSFKPAKREAASSRSDDVLKKSKKVTTKPKVTKSSYLKEQNNKTTTDGLLKSKHKFHETITNVKNLSSDASLDLQTNLNQGKQNQLSVADKVEKDEIEASVNKADLQVKSNECVEYLKSHSKSEFNGVHFKAESKTTVSNMFATGEASHEDKKDNLSKRFTPRKLVTNSASRSEAKNFSSQKDDEIDRVVKKMFSPPPAHSKYKDRLSSPNSRKALSSPNSRKALSSPNSRKALSSPNSRKALSSPARVTLLKESMKTKELSEIQNSTKKLNSSSVSSKTPSRAAPKARKILGVSTPSLINSLNKRKQIEKNDYDSDEDCHICEEPPVSSLEEDDINCGPEDENNMTLSHTSHSQWCSIL